MPIPAQSRQETPSRGAREERLRGLLLRVAEGDAAAMQELFLAERSALHRLFQGMGRCASLADDLVQNTFLSLWRYRANYRGRGSASAYLYRVAIHEWRRELSRGRRRRETTKSMHAGFDGSREPATSGDARTSLEEGEAIARVWRAVEALPEAQREVFLLHRYHGLSCPRIAASLDVNLKTVESRLRLALQKLTRRLRPREEPR